MSLLRIVFDENFSPFVARAMAVMDQDVEVDHLVDMGLGGVSDEEWAAALADEDTIVFTQDDKIRQREHELAAMQRAGLGVYVFKVGKGDNYCSIAERVVRRWAEIKREARRVSRPYVMEVPIKGAVKPFRRR